MDDPRRPHRPRCSWLPTRLMVSFFVCLGVAVPPALAQQLGEPIGPPPAASATGGPAPAATAPLTLDECVRIGMEGQPALAAARASLAAADAQKRALDKLCLASLVSRELPIRKEQASLGVTIAAAGLQQAEWETLYAITRNYFSAVYARKQEQVANDVIDKLKVTRDRVAKLLKDKEVVQVTQNDLDKLNLNIDLYRLRLAEAQRGAELALAALREAMGMPHDCPLPLALTELPPAVEGLELRPLIDLALARRGELAQARTAARVTELEVEAQGTSLPLTMTMRTFAMVSDIHSRPIPQGVSNREYRPGAIGLDMPPMLAGRRHDRQQRARELSARAGSVVDKTTNLIVLETEAAYLKWKEAADRVRILAPMVTTADQLAERVHKQDQAGKGPGEESLRARTLLEQVRSQYNEALYLHTLALAALERVTAGGLQPGFRRHHP